MKQRHGEDGRTHFRSDRIVQINNKWYFLARETEDPLGPFGSQDGAMKEAEDYLRDLKTYSNPTLLYRPIRR